MAESQDIEILFPVRKFKSARQLSEEEDDGENEEQLEEDDQGMDEPELDEDEEEDDEEGDLETESEEDKEDEPEEDDVEETEEEEEEPVRVKLPRNLFSSAGITLNQRLMVS